MKLEMQETTENKVSDFSSHNTKNSILFVISRFSEPVHWINSCISKGIPFLVYDKSPVPMQNAITCYNVGREAETLLRYIIANYDSLPETLVFLQGDPRGTPPMYSYDQAVSEVERVYNERHIPRVSHDAILTCRQMASLQHVWAKKAVTIYTALFGRSDVSFWYAGGAQYIIPRASILCRPLEFYKLLRELVVKFGNQGFDAHDPSMKLGLDAWTMEIMWGPIFDPQISLLDDYAERLMAQVFA